MSRITLDRILAAATAIDPVFLNTPQFLCEPLADDLGARLTIKVETVNPIRSFKGRGATWLTANLTGREPLMCASAGNFGQAMAYACRSAGVPLTVYASVNANPLKIERMRALGATVELAGEDFDAAKAIGKSVASDRGVRFVEDSLDPEPTVGAGTMALELAASADEFDALIVPLGNGAMLAGVATAMKALRPKTKIIAVQSTGAPAMIESLVSGTLVTHERIDTIADGIGVRSPVPQALEDLQGLVDEFLLVPDETTLQAMKLLHRHAGLVVEPSGGIGVGAVIEHRARFACQRVATIICGGNLTESQVADWLG
ncbi:MAG: threonine/serine dehydratase [Chloroflexota bacterium]